jgi:Holliday junction resolvase RusA-like endonuclease
MMDCYGYDANTCCGDCDACEYETPTDIEVTKMIKFTIPIPPTAQMRPKRSKFGRMYKNKKQDTRENQIIGYLIQKKPDSMLEGPLSLVVRAVMPRPKSHFGTGKNSGKLKDSAPYWHSCKPDLSNIIKQIEDCMEGLFFKNDSQIASEIVSKRYGLRPRWEIEISKLKDVT